MVSDANSPSEVLHSEHHSKLSAEEIAKAVARHNRHHPATAEQVSGERKKNTKGSQPGDPTAKRKGAA
jgi:hypothetical protein